MEEVLDARLTVLSRREQCR